MKKDIYIIKNKNNDKVYIGQTVNPAQRWAQYKSAVLHKPNQQLITKAMNKYGFETFWMEILEPNVENYDEREQYWIAFYNSVQPNGYNLAPGGQGTGIGTFAPGAAIKDKETLQKIIEDLILDEESIKELAKKYQVNYQIISEINQGHTYFNEDLHYPLRDTFRYSEEKIKQITYALKYELDKSLKDISKEYHCDISYLNDINQGHSHFREYISYPIRKGKMKKAEEIFPLIFNDLKETSLKSVEIAKKYNVSAQCVSDINCGRKFFQKGTQYPLREKSYDGKTFLSPNELEEIYKLLRDSNLSINKISQQYGISSAALCNINRGKTKKYFDPNIKYPIRPLKK